MSLPNGCVRILVAGSVLLAAAAPGAAAQNEGTLVVQVESWFAAESDNELDFATVDEAGGLLGGGELRTLDHARSQAPRLYAGWRFGAGASPEVGMSVWEHEDNVFEAVAEMPDRIGALLASPSLPIEEDVDSADARAETRATAVDLDVRWRPDVGEASRLVLRAGVRLFRFEERSVVTYLDQEMDFFGNVLDTSEFINTTGDASGFGPRVGAEFTHAFGDRFSVGGAFGVSLPVGEIEGLTTETVLVDDDGPGGQNPSLAGATVIDRPATRRSFVQLEGALRFEVVLGGGWTALAGYGFEHWSGVQLRPRLVDGQNGNALVLDEIDVAFEGASLGVRFEF